MIPGQWAIIFYPRYQDYWAEEGVLDMWGATLPRRLSCGDDQSIWISWTHYNGRMGKAHWIHAAVNNRQAEHQSTMLETSGIITDQTLRILIDPSAIESFIFGAMLKRIKVKALK